MFISHESSTIPEAAWSSVRKDSKDYAEKMHSLQLATNGI